MTDYVVGTGAAGTLTLRVTQSSQDVGTNGSWDHWELYLSSSYRNTFQNSAKACQVQINGNVYNGTFTFNFNNYTDLLIMAGDTWVPHEADGSKATAVYGYIAATGTSSIGGPASVSGTFYQSTIPRASTATISPQPIDAGATLTINTNRASGSFTHTIEYYFGGASGTIATGVVDSTTWVVPMSLLTQIPNTTSGVGAIRTHTYNGGTYIGYKDTQLIINVPASVVPTFTLSTPTEAVAGVAANVGAFVQSISKLNLAITSAAGAYGSTISSYKLTINGQTINAASGVTNFITASGTQVLTGVVTDSRGRTTTKTLNVTIMAYSPPTLGTVTAKRALVSGTLNDDGTYIRVDLAATIQSLVVGGTQRNAVGYKISTRTRGTSTWALKTTQNPGGISLSTSYTVGTYVINGSFDVLIEIYDDFVTTAVQLTVPTAAIFMHWDSTLGVGVGKYRQQGMLDVLGQIYQNDGQAVTGVRALGNYGLSLDTLIESGWYTGYNFIGNPDGAGIGVLEVIAYSPDWIVQNLYMFRSDNNGVHNWQRERTDGTTWRPWQRLYITAAEILSVSPVVATVSGTVTPSAAMAMDSARTSIKKYGNVVNLQIGGTLPGGVGNNQLIATIPVGFRPALEVNGSSILYGSGAGGGLIIYPDGSVLTATNNIGGYTIIRGLATWIL